MARISTYDLDTNITVKDIIIGSDGEHGSRYATKNFSVGDIAEFITKYIEDNSPCCNSTITTSTTTLMPTTTTTTLLPTTTTTTLLPTTTTTTILVPTTTTTTTTLSDCSLSGFFIETAVPTTTTTTTTTAVTLVKYGYLYSWPVASGSFGNVANTGWHVPTKYEFQPLAVYLDPAATFSTNISGGALKETGTTYWSSPNTGATNSSRFNARGSGLRGSDGVSSTQMAIMLLWTSDNNLGSGISATVHFDSTKLDTSFAGQGLVYYPQKTGGSIRLVKDTTSLVDGESGVYTGNDGKIYRTICIGTQEWLADNLLETLYRDLSPITLVTGDANWAAQAGSAIRASYGDDENNAI
jgi:uncharacterized protein (TIGR02145 family)